MTKADKENKPKIIHNTLHLAACSDLRRRILIALKNGKKPLRELRDSLGVSSTTAIHALRELEKDNLLFQAEDRGYALTNIGEVMVLKLVGIIDVIEVLKKHEDFWLEHDLSGIAPHLLDKMVYDRNSALIGDDEKALSWGRELHEHYRKRSTVVDL